MGKSFVDTITSQTLNLDLSRAMGGSREMSGLITDLFLIVIRMREAEDLGDPAALRKLISYYLELFKKNCKVIGVADDSVQEALYAIVALIDETVLSVPGACRDYWLDRPLQLDFFGDIIAGEEFFTKLQKLISVAEKKKDALEIYYLCLSLGFEGKYKLLDPEGRNGVIDEAGKRLRRVRIRGSSALSPHGNRSDPFPRKKRAKISLPLWAGAVIAGGVCAGVYLLLLMITSLDITRVLRIVELVSR